MKIKEISLNLSLAEFEALEACLSIAQDNPARRNLLFYHTVGLDGALDKIKAIRQRLDTASKLKEPRDDKCS
jgi:predicted ATP-dependent serine protease